MNDDAPKLDGFDSRDSVILIVDGPADNEVRPCRPSLLPLLIAEREKIKRYEAMGYGPDTGECVNLIIDGPIDNEVRPCRPERLEFLKAETEKIKRYEAMRKEREEKEQEPPAQAN